MASCVTVIYGYRGEKWERFFDNESDAKSFYNELVNFQGSADTRKFEFKASFYGTCNKIMEGKLIKSVDISHIGDSNPGNKGSNGTPLGEKMEKKKSGGWFSW